MDTYFLVGWNDEYLEQRIVAGPFGWDQKAKNIKTEVIKRLKMIYGMDEKTAETIYQGAVAEDDYLRMYDDEMIDLDVWSDGASLRYGGGEEDRIEIVKYNFENQIQVKTPAGTILSKIMPDDDYLGISTLIQKPGEPGAIVEYDPGRDCIVCRIYTTEDPDGEPIIIECK